MAAERKTSTTRGERSHDERTTRRSAPRAAAPKRPRAAQVADSAAGQLQQLLGKELEGVTGLERTDEGWVVEVDVLELRRVPGTTDVIATYQVTTDSNGDLEGYRRTSRYLRGDTGKE